jgi:hypothetical protein
MHDFLNDLRWLVRNLHARPTCLQEIIDTALGAIGPSDAAASGMGGVLFIPARDGTITPLLWRSPFPRAIQQDLVSTANPAGTTTNFDLELAGTIAQHDVLVQHVDC